MAYTYRFHTNSGPMKLNRTSWGPVTSPTQIELPNKQYGRPLSGNFDRIINSFDRTNAFECVRSAFEQASQPKTIVEVALQQPEKETTAACNKTAMTHRSSIMFEKTPEEKERFYGCGDMIVNGRSGDHLSSSYERADVGLASRKTPCTDEEVTEYYRDRLYMSQARQLFPLQEDLADWINKTIGITHLTGDNFLNVLDNGVELCQLAMIIRDKAKEATEKGIYHGPVPQVRGRCWQRAARRSFFSRDNMENFITFCRQLGVHENLLFESDDLVMHAQPRNVILCLLELARIATKFKVEPPGLVQLEREIALEEAGVTDDKDARLSATLGWQFQQENETDGAVKDGTNTDQNPSLANIEAEDSLPVALFTTESEDNRSVNTDDTWSRGTSEDLDGVPLKPLTELDKRVQNVTRLMQRNCNCSEGKCSKLLKVKKVGEGRYNIAGRNVFIRLLKGRHMMVRVGGGWDTLEHFLTRHDPCQVRVISSQSASAIPKVTTVDLVQPSLMLTTTSIENAILESIEAQRRNSSNSTADIYPIDIPISTIESVSETSSVNSIPISNISSKSNGKVSPCSGKSTPNSVKSCSTSSKTSGRTTPLQNGKISPRNLKSPTYNRVLPFDSKSNINGKVSPSSLKLDLTNSTNNRRIKSAGVINNRMISPIESSTRLLPASSRNNIQNNRNVRTPTNEGRKSFPSAMGTDGNGAMRRRSLNLSLPSTNSKLIKSPSRTVRSQSLKSPINRTPNSVTNLKSPTTPVSPSSIEKSVKMALPLQTSTPNKSFLHIRAKYRSPPPRDVPPR